MRRPLSFSACGRRYRARVPFGARFVLALAAWFVVVVPSRADDVRIGLAVPLSGPMAGAGLTMQRALEAAVQDANAAGGVLGRQISVVAEDDGCASATSEGAASRLMAAGAQVVIGHPCSVAAVSAGPLYGRGGVFLIAVGPRHPDVTRGNDQLPVPVLRLSGRDDRQGSAAASWLLEHAPGRRIGIVHDRTAYARGIKDSATAALVAGNATVTEVPLVAAQHDYEVKLAALKEAGAEALLFAGYPEEADIVLSALKRLDLSVPLLGTDSLATQAFADRVAEAKATVQVLLPNPLSRSNDEATRLASTTRAAFDVWVGTVRRMGTLDGAAISSALRGGPAVQAYDLGAIRFDKNGDLEMPAFVPASARNGQWTIGQK